MRRYDASSPLISIHVPRCAGVSLAGRAREAFVERHPLEYAIYEFALRTYRNPDR